MMIEVLYEDKEIIVVVKPVGVASQSEKGFGADMVSEILNYLKRKGEEANYLGVVHRLDKPVSGVMVYAKTKEAASALSASLRSASIIKGRKSENTGFAKKYLALISKTPIDLEGTLEDYMVFDRKTNMSVVSSAKEKDAKKAVLHYKVLPEKSKNEVAQYLKIVNFPKEACLVEIKLETGRHHQIRVQFASREMSLIGDSRYGEQVVRGRIGLFAYELGFHHPTTGEWLVFTKKHKND